MTYGPNPGQPPYQPPPPQGPPPPGGPSGYGIQPPPPPGSGSSSGGKVVLIVAVAVIGSCLLLGIVGAILGTTSTGTTSSVGTSSTVAVERQVSQTQDSATDDPPTDDPTTTERVTTTTLETTTTTEPTTTTSAYLPQPERPFAGTGDQVVTVDPPITQPMLATLTYGGDGNFIVNALDAQGDNVDLLANEIGTYSGVRPVNFSANTPVALLEVNASGPWTIVFRDVTTAPVADTGPGARYDGSGNQVVVFRTAKLAKVEFACPYCDGNTVVTAWGDRRDLLVNEIGAYSGTVLVPGDNLLLEIQTQGARGGPPAWSLTVVP